MGFNCHKENPRAKPPILNIEPLAENSTIIIYSSPRGMFGYFYGLLKGTSRYYDEKISIAVLKKTQDFSNELEKYVIKKRARFSSSSLFYNPKSADAMVK
ncbi:MAG: hypothetical protein GXZ06_09060 [Tissierellia bacterium]|nr:hypothetical protein [Tissierellia bacterium]